MRKYRVLLLILALTFVYCWVKFYATFKGSAQGLYGSTSKGDFFFYFELVSNFIVIAYFICCIFFSLKLSKHKEQRQNKRLLFTAFIFLLLATVYGTLSYGEDRENVFAYLDNHARYWSFWSANFLMEYIILTLLTGPVFFFKWMSYYLWK